MEATSTTQASSAIAGGNNPFKDIAKSKKLGKEKRQFTIKPGSFQSLGLFPGLLSGIQKLGYRLPTPIQRKTIPLVMDGKDVIAMARTGSGKTAAFLIPIIQKLKEHKLMVGARALILSPTRELTMQSYSFCTKLCKYTNLRAAHIVGGDALELQFEKLAGNPDIILATPGRLRHLLGEVSTLSLKSVEFLVFDEGDRLFELGFQDDIMDILSKCPEHRQTLVFSATLPSLLASFTRVGLNQPTTIRLDSEAQLSEHLQIQFITVRSKDKEASLMYLLKDFIELGKQIIVFVATRHQVEYLAALLAALYTEPQGVCIYGKMDQSARKINLAKFANKLAHVMFVTDLAARGIDIPLLDVVINYDFPPKPKLFVHRVGRTARAGKSGVAYSLVTKSEMPFVLDLMLYLGRKLYNPDEVFDDVNGVTYGMFPRILLESTSEQISLVIAQKMELQALQKSMVNAHKLYMKTRNPASSASGKRAKELNYELPHVLLKGLVDDNELKRIEMLNQLKAFRPQQTIFEQEEAAEKSVLTMQGKRKEHSFSILKEKERQLKKQEKKQREEVLKEEEKEEQKQRVTVKDLGERLSGQSYGANDKDGVEDGNKEDEKEDEDEDEDEEEDEEEEEEEDEDADEDEDDKNEDDEYFSSKHEGADKASATAAEDESTSEHELDSINNNNNSKNNLSGKKPTQASYKDDQFYLPLTPKNHFAEKGLQIEKENTNIEDFVLDLIPDEAESVFRKKTVTVWDKKKNNFVTRDASTLGKKQKVRNEAGQLVSRKEQGTFYSTWMKKTKKEVGKVGDEEAKESLGYYQAAKQRSKYLHHKDQKQIAQRRDAFKAEQRQIHKKRLKEKRAEKFKKIQENKKRKREGGDSGGGGKRRRF